MIGFGPSLDLGIWTYTRSILETSKPLESKYSEPSSTFLLKILLMQKVISVGGSPMHQRVYKVSEGGVYVNFFNLGGTYIPNLSLLIWIESFEKFVRWW